MTTFSPELLTLVSSLTLVLQGLNTHRYINKTSQSETYYRLTTVYRNTELVNKFSKNSIYMHTNM